MSDDLKYNLFLDDERIPSDVFNYTQNKIYLQEFKIVRNFDAFKTIINYELKAFGRLPKLISFDHDLADEHYAEGHRHDFLDFDYSKVTEKTGYDCAKYFCDFVAENNIQKNNFPMILAHTKNTVGKVNIESYINNFKKHYYDLD